MLLPGLDLPVIDYGETREVSLREILEAMAHCRDDETFRWFQTSYVGGDFQIHAGPTLRVTMGQARRELGVGGDSAVAVK